jgi:RNA polymerase sigma factor (sigma-70 family)
MDSAPAPANRPDAPRAPRPAAARAGAAGGARAFRALFDEHLPFVRELTIKLMARRGVNESDLDDIVQKIFISLHAKHPSLDPAVPMRKHLKRICRNQVKLHARGLGNSREDPTDTLDDEPGAARTPAAIAEDRELLERVDDAIDELDERQRRVLLLFACDEKTPAEIAAELSVSPATVYGLLARAREALVRLAGLSPAEIGQGDEPLPEKLREMVRAARAAPPVAPEERDRLWALLPPLGDLPAAPKLPRLVAKVTMLALAAAVGVVLFTFWQVWRDRSVGKGAPWPDGMPLPGATATASASPDAGGPGMSGTHQPVVPSPP